MSAKSDFVDSNNPTITWFRSSNHTASAREVRTAAVLTYNGNENNTPWDYNSNRTVSIALLVGKHVLKTVPQQANCCDFSWVQIDKGREALNYHILVTVLRTDFIDGARACPRDACSPLARYANASGRSRAVGSKLCSTALQLTAENQFEVALHFNQTLTIRSKACRAAEGKVFGLLPDTDAFKIPIMKHTNYRVMRDDAQFGRAALQIKGGTYSTCAVFEWKFGIWENRRNPFLVHGSTLLAHMS
ncbi:hypothetical protein C8R44DRAFT_740814 [Mycena epipterygia]|nr:hypothetical protein C8R44DRAFT_740814 [Mycena epipterygia]